MNGALKAAWALTAFVVMRHLAPPLFWALAARTDRARGTRDVA